MVHGPGLIHDISVRIVGAALGRDARTFREIGHRAQSILMIEERRAGFGHRDGFIDARAVGVAGLQDIRAVLLQQNVLAVVDVALRLAVGDLFNPAA